MQKIYMQGAGPINPDNGWTHSQETRELPMSAKACCGPSTAFVPKMTPSNRPAAGVEINDGNPCSRTGYGSGDCPPSRSPATATSAAPPGSGSPTRDGDPRWLEESGEDLRVLVLVHRMAANRLNFPRPLCLPERQGARRAQEWAGRRHGVGVAPFPHRAFTT